ncbi:neuraminidase-like domain-containing protein [Pseudomonas sp. KCJK9016]|uniref:Tc toxin subunit A-related protein n=1 Tax=Pseudomonas sp. KCJK9016 TaxID=3344556 RepID=UPI003905C542
MSTIVEQLNASRRDALVAYAKGNVARKFRSAGYSTSELGQLLAHDVEDGVEVQTSPVADAIRTAQRYVTGIYNKMDPGYRDVDFPKTELSDWEWFYREYSNWSARTSIEFYPENFMTSDLRFSKTRLFESLEMYIDQGRLTNDTVLAGVQEYVREFEGIANLDVLSCCMDSHSPPDGNYCFVARDRVPPYGLHWRKAQVALTHQCTGLNPTDWSEYTPIDVPLPEHFVDVRPVWWNGQLWLVWVEWHEPLVRDVDGEPVIDVPSRLEIQAAVKRENDHWSAPWTLHSVESENNQGWLIATVVADDLQPRGALTVDFINDKGTIIRATRDVLLRPLKDHPLAFPLLTRFVFPHRDIVQRPVSFRGTVSISPAAAETPGSLVGKYGLHVVACRSAGKDYVLVRAYCDPLNSVAKAKAKNKTRTRREANADFELTLENRNTDDPSPIKQSLSDQGGWEFTAVMEISRSAGSFTELSFLLGGTETNKGTFGRDRFKVKVETPLSFAPQPSLVLSNAQGAQFLRFNQSDYALRAVRLNTLFAAALVAAAAISIEAVLDWAMQFFVEPELDAGTPIFEPNGCFDGANGLYFWELFYHLPEYVAWRLTDEGRHQEAQDWLHYIFNPALPEVAAHLSPESEFKPDPMKAWWRCRPLVSQGHIGCGAARVADPVAIGYEKPRHFRIYIFMAYVANLMAWGDRFYRNFTSDSLEVARSHYLRAQHLMGTPPVVVTATRWVPKTLKDLLEDTKQRTVLEEFERSCPVNSAQLPSRSGTAPWLGVIGTENFRLPINAETIRAYELPGQRLFNLRHGLTIDGVPGNLPLFQPKGDPRQLLSALASGGSAPSLSMAGRVADTRRRWSYLFDVAMSGVATLQEWGNRVQSLLQECDNAEMLELERGHLVAMGEYARVMQEQTIEQLLATQAALEQSQRMAQERADEFSRRHAENISPKEYSVMELMNAARETNLLSTVLTTVGGGLDALPVIFGLATGGMRPSGIPNAAAAVLQITSMASSMSAEKSAAIEGYRRRAEDWDHTRKQALAEVKVFEAQINAHKLGLEAARTGLAQTIKSTEQALVQFEFVQKRAAGLPLYRWLLSQYKVLYYKAYDAVLGLCRSAETALKVETGNYDLQFIRPNMWQDDKHGLTSGDWLRLDMLLMQTHHAQHREYRLEITRTFSLKELFDDPLDPQDAFTDWETARGSLVSNGVLNFKITQLRLDRDYPGLFCRQIDGIELTFPAVTGAWQDIHARLLQTGSVTLVKPAIGAVKYLHTPESSAPPAEVVFNILSGQSIALSSGINDSGLVTLKPDDGGLKPFEYTGAVSQYRLSFPYPDESGQSQILNSITDVIVRVRYTAKDGGPVFTRSVQDLVKRALDPEKKASLSKSSRGRK